MDYDNIILELMSRIQVLEKEVAEIKNNSAKNEITREKCDIKISDTEKARQYIEKCKENALKNGEKYVVLRAGDIQRAIGLKNRPVIICNAMNKCMCEGDEILHTTPSGYSTTVTIKYYTNTKGVESKMRGEITLPMVEECYNQAKRVLREVVTMQGAAKIAETKTGINNSSAMRTIDSIVKMLQGRFYASIINNDGMTLIFKKIEEDYGEKGVEKAVRASIEHIKYLTDTQGNNKVFLRDLVNEYIEQYDLHIDLI